MEVGFEDILNVGRLSEANFAPKETNDPKLSDRMGMVVMHSVELEELMKNGAYHRWRFFLISHEANLMKMVARKSVASVAVA